MVRYKERCIYCKKNWAIVTFYKQRPICEECEMKFVREPVEDPEYKKLFDINEKYYKESSFLRSIRVNYARFGSLSQKQIDVFKKVASELKSGKTGERREKKTRKKRERKFDFVVESSLEKKED